MRKLRFGREAVRRLEPGHEVVTLENHCHFITAKKKVEKEFSFKAGSTRWHYPRL
jgi:hypothetical protein